MSVIYQFQKNTWRTTYLFFLVNSGKEIKDLKGTLVLLECQCVYVNRLRVKHHVNSEFRHPNNFGPTVIPHTHISYMHWIQMYHTCVMSTVHLNKFIRYLRVRYGTIWRHQTYAASPQPQFAQTDHKASGQSGHLYHIIRHLHTTCWATCCWLIVGLFGAQCP